MNALSGLSLFVALSAATPTSDPVIDALRDELERVPSLRADALPPAYYASYAVHDVEQTTAMARFGALVTSGSTRGRVLSPNVRIGDHDFDAPGFPTRMDFVVAPWEDDYDALRHQLWLLTDDVYKTGVQQYESALAERKQSTRAADDPGSWSREQPHTYVEPAEGEAFDLDAHEDLARALSAVFRDHAHIHESEARVVSMRVRRRFASTEGTTTDDTETLAVAFFGARTQAEDGAYLSDERVFVARSLDALPARSELVAAAHAMAKSLAELRSAPVVEDFTGPVLFEGRAAVQLFAYGLLPELTASPFGGRDDGKLGKRVLPEGFSVVDDPSLTELDGTTLLGHYAVDEQGIPAQRVQLVARGKQTDLLRGRTPTKGKPSSNGHARGSWPGITLVAPGNVIVRNAAGLNGPALEKRLLARVKAEGLDHGFVVRELGDNPWSPAEVFRVDKTGKRQRVRVDRMRLPEAKDFARLVASGRELTVENMLTSGGRPGGGLGGGLDGAIASVPAAIAVPSLLFDDVELDRNERDRPKPPLYPHPHFAK